MGVVGLPASYGGFETLAEQLVCSSFFELDNIFVYCEAAVAKASDYRYKNAALVSVPFKANGWQSIPYDCVSMFKACKKGGVLLILGTSATLFLPVFKLLFPNVKFVVNMAGLEWSRSKWSNLASWYLKLNERFAIKNAHVTIADNQGLSEYVDKNYSVATVCIPYGGDQGITYEPDKDSLQDLILPDGDFDLAISRAQPDNNIEMILSSYSYNSIPLVFISNWESCNFGKDMRARFGSFSNIHLIDPIFDLNKLAAIRARARLYVHGHSAGGTNPVLVETMWHSLPIVSFDVNFNRHTTHGEALFFSNKEELISCLNSITREWLDETALKVHLVAVKEYSWSRICKRYHDVLTKEYK